MLSLTAGIHLLKTALQTSDLGLRSIQHSPKEITIKAKNALKSGKDKRYFCLIEIGFIAKKENELHLFYSIYLTFHLIPKIYFK